MARHGARPIAVGQAFSQTSPAATAQAFAAGLARAALRPWARLRRVALSRRRSSEADGASRPAAVDRPGVAAAPDPGPGTQIEAERRQAEKIYALAQLSGGVAHDVNNLLLPIGLALEILGEGRGPGDDAHPALARAQHAVVQAKALTARLLAFARQQELDPTPLDVNQSVVGVLRKLRQRAAPSIAIETSLGDDLWPAVADRRQFEAALLNIAMNARDAMPAGGSLQITTNNLKLYIDDQKWYAAAGTGEFIEVAVKDTGLGMPPEVRDRAVEPLFTTKRRGTGAGLGLSQAYGFVKQSGGHLRIDSEPGQGTRVSLLLPRSPEAPATAPATGCDAPVGGREKILMVEDTAILRGAVKRMLVSLGYEVIDVATAHEAIDILASSTPLDVLFTDILLAGGISGGEVAEAARRPRPLMPIVFTSGYTQARAAELGGNGADALFLSKPYTKAELAARLCQALGERRAAG
jgi:signal transduction histidine kinase/ActR/RegA family two-component response regulator